MRWLNWIWIAIKKCMEHPLISMIASGYIIARKRSMDKPGYSDWVPTSLCENMRWSSLKESIPNLIVLIFIWYVMLVLDFSTRTVLIGDSSDILEYNLSLVMILVHICTRQRCFPVCHWVNVALLTPFFCDCNIGYTFSANCTRPLLWIILCCFLLN